MRLTRLHILLSCLLVAETPGPAQESVPINETRFHLGREGMAEWEEFAVSKPYALRLDVPFGANANESESTLLLQQDDVRYDWKVEINGRQLGKLFLMEADLISSFAVPAGLLKEGENVLSILPPDQIDDIEIGRAWLVYDSLDSVLHESVIDVRVTSEDEGAGLPARITITDEQGSLVAMTEGRDDDDRPVAIRPGVAYIGPKGASIGLPAGDYTIFASRGFEYGVATNKLTLAPGESKRLRLSIRREIPTPGWVSTDTHVHTFTHSRHGDATMDERVLTLAGEGVELPIATDHNFHASFAESAEQMGVSNFFTPVIGNEITTSTAHFNVFPVKPGSRAPDFRIPSWTGLIDHIRETTDARVVILNHPMNVHNGFQPFSATNFNNITGENLRGPEFTFDAIELLNSSAQQSDFMTVYNGWFALLNHGYRITGVGSSDGHDVSRYIVGQGRSYIQTEDDDPARIDVDDASNKLIEGRALASMGLLVNLGVAAEFHVGDLATSLPETFEVSAQVFGPSWVSATNVTLFANGISIRNLTLTGNDGRPGLKATVNWKLDRPAHDVHLVAIATGPGVTAPFWAIPRPYQPSSKEWVGRVIGSTNPVWVDGDNDGEFESARVIAEELLNQTGSDPTEILGALSNFDEAVAAQAASLSVGAGATLESDSWQDALRAAGPTVRDGFRRFSENVPR